MIRRYILDSGPAFDYLFRRKGIHLRVDQLRLRGFRIGIGLPTLGEIAAGIERSASRDKSWLIAKRYLNAFVLWPFNKPAALEYGIIHGELQRLGRPMQNIDIMIAAIARSLGSSVVVTNDSDLSAIPNLNVENWSLPPSAP